MAAAIRIHVRYDIPDENETTRRERNEAAAEDGVDLAITPIPDIPLGAEHLWEWYQDICKVIDRTRDGICHKIAPEQFRAWAEMTSNIIRPAEYVILWAMDAAYCIEMTKELAAYQKRLEDARKTGVGQFAEG